MPMETTGKEKKKDISAKIEVYGTEDGKLFIKPEELLSLDKVKDIIVRARKLNLAKKQHQVT